MHCSLGMCSVFVAILFGCGCDNTRDSAGPGKSNADVTKSAEGESNARSGREPLIVLAAASTAEAVEAVARKFQHESHDIAVVSPGPSNTLAAQIIAGAPADLFLSAHEKWTTTLGDKGLVEKVQPLLTNDLVLIVPEGNPAGVQSPADLLSDQVKKVALAGENVPAGIYAQQALTAANVYEQLVAGGKIARGQDVRATLSYVQRGEAEAGVVYSTDAKISKRVRVASTFDPSTFDRIVYPLALLKETQNKQGARKLFEYLQSSEAEAIFESHGFKRLR